MASRLLSHEFLTTLAQAVLAFTALFAAFFGRWELIPLNAAAIIASMSRRGWAVWVQALAAGVASFILFMSASSAPAASLLGSVLPADVGGDVVYVGCLAVSVLSLAAVMGLLWLMAGTEFTVNAVVLLVIYGFLVSIFRPELMFSMSITTGGDTASHYLPAKFLAEELLPKGRLIGWLPGWYGGMPLFQFYFPLPFLLMALLSYVIPLQIAFKLVSVLGIFLLPLCALQCMRLMGFRFPAPAYAAAFTLPFLFMESHSMWGGNIPSTMAGEFTYGIGLSLTILFFGALYRGLGEGRHVLHNAVLLAAIALCHVYTVLWAVASSTFLLLVGRARMERPPWTRAGFAAYAADFTVRLSYLAKSYPLAFMLAGFWVVPLIIRLKHTTSYDIPWNITEEVLPPILWPYLILALYGIYRSIRGLEHRMGFYVYSIGMALVFFFLAHDIGVVDIRFLPFVYLALMMLAAYGLSEASAGSRSAWTLPLIALLLTVFWVDSNKQVVVVEKDVIKIFPKELSKALADWKYGGYSAYWAKWNYEGFEAKPEWKPYKAANDFLRGGPGDPRAQFEHNDQYNSAGTVRAFESIPLFSGRSILEGLYMQSIHTSPFSFYIQSEISDQQSCPYWAVWPCAHFNLEDGARHLKMFNVRHIVARSEKLKAAVRNGSGWRLAFSADPYEVWELTSNPDHYVTVPVNEPVLFETSDWKNISYTWFRGMELLDTPVAFAPSSDPKDAALFRNIVKNPSVESLDSLPSMPVGRACRINESVTAESIEFTTDCVGAPHIVGVSYYPSWAVDGADRIYLVSPSFMLVYPTGEHVRLYYAKRLEDWFGIALTVSAAALIAYAFLSRDRRVRDFFLIGG